MRKIKLNSFQIPKIRLSLVFLTIFALSFAPLTQAQLLSQVENNSPNQLNQTPELNLSLNPPITYLSIQPGETKSFQLSLKNSGSRNLQIQLQLAEFESDNLTGQPIIKLNSKFNWLNPRDSEWAWQKPHLLKSGESTKIWLDIAVPTSAKFAEHHLTILAQAAAASETSNNSSYQAGGGQSSVTGFIGSNLILAIAKDAKNLSQLELTDWSIPNWVDSLGRISFDGLVKNSGDHAGPIIGKATLIGPGGQLLKSWLLYPDMVLPNTTRQVRVIDTSQDPLAEPSFWLNLPNVQLNKKLEYQPNWLFGNYVFKIQLFQQDYTDASPISEKTVQITALPYGILALIIIVPICLLLLNSIKKTFDKTIGKHLYVNK